MAGLHCCQLAGVLWRSVRMPSSEFKRIMAELSSIGDTVVISVTKDGIKFSTSGDIGSANVTCRQNTSVDKQASTGALLSCLIASPLRA